MAKVVVQKITGESLEHTLHSADDAVSSFKEAIAGKVQVPAMCQRLTLQNADESASAILEKSKPFMAARVAKPFQNLSIREFSAISSLASPPHRLQRCFTIVVKLLEGGKLLAGKGRKARRTWAECVGFLRPALTFLDAVQNWVFDVFDGTISEEQVSQAEKMAKQMGAEFSPQVLNKTSWVAALLCTWAIGALRFYREDLPRFTGTSLELEDAAPMALYLKDAACHLYLITDLQPLWRALEFNTDERLPAVAALGVLGNRCPSQSLPALAKLMTCSDFKLRAAAARAVQSAWAPGDAAALGILLNFLPRLPSNTFCSSQAVEAVAHLGRGSFQALEIIIPVLNADAEADRDCALAHFTALEDSADAKDVLARLARALEQRSTSQVLDALAILSQRDYSAVLGSMLRFLQGAPVMQARAAEAAAKFAAREEEELVQSMQACLRQLDEKVAATTVAISLVTISPSSYRDAIKALCKQLGTAGNYQPVIEGLGRVAREADEEVIRALVHFVRRGDRVVTSAPQIAYFTAGLDVLKRIASAEVLEEASAQVMWAYANKASKTGEKEFCRAMVPLNCQVKKKVFTELAKGFRHASPGVRNACMEVYRKLSSRALDTAMEVLTDTALHETLTLAQCAALQVLPRIMDETRGKAIAGTLLSLADQATDVAVKSAALGAIRAVPDPSLADSLRRHAQDLDESVRLAALQALLSQPLGAVEICLRSLEDSSSKVALLAAQAIPSLEVEGREEELVLHLTPLLQHGDVLVREAAANALGCSKEGKANALRALQQETAWRERETAVISARQEAIRRLTAAMQS